MYICTYMYRMFNLLIVPLLLQVQTIAKQNQKLQDPTTIPKMFARYFKTICKTDTKFAHRIKSGTSRRLNLSVLIYIFFYFIYLQSVACIFNSERRKNKCYLWNGGIMEKTGSLHGKICMYRSE